MEARREIGGEVNVGAGRFSFWDTGSFRWKIGGAFGNLSAARIGFQGKADGLTPFDVHIPLAPREKLAVRRSDIFLFEI